VDAYFAFAAFVLFICLAVAVYFIIAQRLLIEKLEAAAERNWLERKAMIEEVRKLTAKLARFAPFDADQDGAPGGRKKRDADVVPDAYADEWERFKDGALGRKRHDPYIER